MFILSCDDYDIVNIFFLSDFDAVISRNKSVMSEMLNAFDSVSSASIADAFSKIIECGSQHVHHKSHLKVPMVTSDGSEETPSRALLQRHGWTLGKAKAEGECLFLSIWDCIKGVMGTMLPAELGASFSNDEAARMLRWFAASVGVTLSKKMEERFQMEGNKNSSSMNGSDWTDLKVNSTEWIKSLKLAVLSEESDDKWAVPYVHADGSAVLPIICSLLHLDINMFKVGRSGFDRSCSLKVDQLKFERADWERHVKKVFRLQGRMDVETHQLNHILPWQHSLYEGYLDRDPVGTFTKFGAMDIDECNATSTLFPLWTSGKDNIGISLHLYAVKDGIYHFVPVTSQRSNVGTLQFEASRPQRQALANKLISIWRLWEASIANSTSNECPWEVPSKESWVAFNLHQTKAKQKIPKKKKSQSPKK